MNLIKPLLSDFNLTEELINEIVEFNKHQDKRSWLITHISIFSASILIGLFTFSLISIFYVLLFSYFTASFLLFNYIIKRFVSDSHPLTQNMADYKISVEQYESQKRKQTEEFWFSLTGYEFEREITKILKPFFQEVILTKGSGDGGVDIIVKGNDYVIAVQCKAHKKPIGLEPTRALIGVMEDFNATEAVMINLGGFTKGVISIAAEKSG